VTAAVNVTDVPASAVAAGTLVSVVVVGPVGAVPAANAIDVCARTANISKNRTLAKSLAKRTNDTDATKASFPRLNAKK
jgi:hypothetical protein